MNAGAVLKQYYDAVQRRDMARDFSWQAAAAGYEKLYQDSV